MSTETRWHDRLRHLRETFDAAFAHVNEPAQDAPPRRILQIESAGRSYGVDLDECAAVLVVPALHPLPQAHSAFVGVAVVNGVLLPIYQLAVLLGHAEGESASRRLLVTRGPASVGLLVDRASGPSRTQVGSRHGVVETVQIDGHTWRLLSLDALVAELPQRGAPHSGDGDPLR